MKVHKGHIRTQVVYMSIYFYAVCSQPKIKYLQTITLCAVAKQADRIMTEATKTMRARQSSCSAKGLQSPKSWSTSIAFNCCHLSPTSGLFHFLLDATFCNTLIGHTEMQNIYNVTRDTIGNAFLGQIAICISHTHTSAHVFE